ncbi:WYL domain-containing protein [Streptomyces sp. LX-29]|uniref:helix-turn-helix transcriptional regulator n=1 Tax=Streptomyces sp. LX-29 TaxID=2900152 RepID=UPI00240D7673|nr:WYL domain-containing protein [Streptomyces sp. LX-29]WFB10917.1 WYL domain-containing protein [Streptomyces sp. LX-29]
MKSDRLLSVLLLLQTRGRVPAAELAARLEVSVRTIYRDVESLSAAGVPVYAERGRHGGIALLPGFRTDVTGLTSDEARALFVLAAQGTHSALGLEGAFGSALRKVMAALPAPHRPTAELTSRRILVDPDRWLSGPAGRPDLDTLHDAVFADRRLRIRYRHGGENRPRTYTVDPYGLVAKAGVWYLIADRQGTPQLFRADRVAEASLTDAPVRRRDGVELADVWEELRRRVERLPEGLWVRTRVRRSRLDMFIRIIGAARLAGLPPTVPAPDHAEDTPETGGAEGMEGTEGAAGEGEADGRGADEDAAEDGDEWVPVAVSCPVPVAARQLLQFGADVEVLGPPEARAAVAEAAARLAAMYADDIRAAGATGGPDGG